MKISRAWIFPIGAASFLSVCQGQQQNTPSTQRSAVVGATRDLLAVPGEPRSPSADAPSSTSSSSTLSLSRDVAANASLSDILTQIPSCAKQCMQEAISKAECKEASCICSDRPLEGRMSKCVQSACSLSNLYETINITESACNRPRRDRSVQYNATSIAMCTITGILVIVRAVFKKYFSFARQLKADDWMITGSVLVGLPATVLNVQGFTKNGLGKDVWTLKPAMVAEFARYFYIQQILYVFLITTVKLALLFFYLSIFPGVNTRRVLWGTVVVTTMFGLTFILISVFQCTPISFYWMQYVEDAKGKCTEINLLGWIHGVVSVAIDVWMIGIPLYEVRKLELHWKKKIGAAIMFLTGTFVTVVSGLRLQSLILFANSINPTWDEWPVALWSTIEINVGLLCACLPTVRLILVRIWPRVFGGSMSSGARSRTSRGNSVLARRQQLRIASIEIQMEATSPRRLEEQVYIDRDGKHVVYNEHKGSSQDGMDNDYKEHVEEWEDGCHAR